MTNCLKALSKRKGQDEDTTKNISLQSLDMSDDEL
jgi:hypothetical protein